MKTDGLAESKATGEMAAAAVTQAELDIQEANAALATLVREQKHSQEVRAATASLSGRLLLVFRTGGYSGTGAFALEKHNHRIHSSNYCTQYSVVYWTRLITEYSTLRSG